MLVVRLRRKNEDKNKIKTNKQNKTKQNKRQTKDHVGYSSDFAIVLPMVCP